MDPLQDCPPNSLDTEHVYTRIASGLIERYSRLQEPHLRQVDMAFKARVMGSSKAAGMRLMIDTFRLQVGEEEYLEECSRMEVLQCDA